MTDLFQELYKKYEILNNAKDKISEHSADFQACINATKSSPKEKKLAAQIIGKYFKHFPDLQDEAFNALLDLCEENGDIRICAVKVLPTIAKSNKAFVVNIASILSQLLQLEDQEYVIACHALTEVFNEDPVSTTKGIIGFIQSEDGALREKIVVFLYKKLAAKQPDLEDSLIECGKNILPDCSSEEFLTIMFYLTKSKLVKLPQGQQELVNLVAEKIEISEPFEPLNKESHVVDRLILSVQSIIPLFNANIESTQFTTYYCNQVLPQLEAVVTLEDGPQLQFRLLRQLARLSTYCGNIENISEVVEKLFEKLKEFMPLPPEDLDVTKVPNLDFTSVECLLYAFHRLARKCPEFLTNDQDRLKDFRARLQYFSRGVQGCKRGLENSINNKNELTEENLEKVKIAPAVLDNINSIIKDLFYQTPLYKCNVKLSFQEETKTINNQKEKVAIGSQKRHAPITFDSSNGVSHPKQNRSITSGEDRKLYQPPTGKFSSTFGGRSNTRNNWNRNTQRGQRNGRASGGRNWRN